MNSGLFYYYGCITVMDEQIGRLRAALHRLNIAENTLVFFAFDNGPAGKGGGVAQQPGARQQGALNARTELTNNQMKRNTVNLTTYIMRILLLILLSATFTGCRQNSGSDVEKPNILFLFADDMRYSAIHALNNEAIITPNLDELNRRSTVFRNAYILGAMNAAVCAPSRAMLMTGRELFQNPPGGTSIPETLVTLPQTFRENGYQTFGTGKWHNGKASYARSFSAGSDILFGGMTSSQYQLPLYEFDSTGVYSDNKRRSVKGIHSSTVYAEAAIEFLKHYDKKAPFFMYVAFQAPHDPRQAPEAYLETYDTTSLHLPPNFLPGHPFDNGELDVRDEKLAGFPRQPSAIKEHIRDYYAMITHLDYEIGRVIEALKASGEFDNTVIVFSADNGLALGQHGLMGKQNLYEHSIKVPLMIAGPGISSKQLEELICLSDLFPTLADIAGVPVPQSVTGHSYKQLIHGEGSGKRETLYFAYKNFQRAYRKGDWKLIGYNVKGAYHEQLFNLKDDPWETNDLRAENPEQAAALKAELQQALEKAGDSVRFEQPGWGVAEIPSWAEKVKGRQSQVKNH